MASITYAPPRTGRSYSGGNSRPVVLLLWLVLFLLVGSSQNNVVAYSDDCPDHEDEFVFELALDEDSPYEQGYSLVCDTVVEWEVEPGSIQYRTDLPYISRVGYVRRTICVGPESTCYFTITDDYGDGLEEGDAWYSLKLGAETLVETKSVKKHVNFDYVTHCFGVACDMIPQEVEESCDYVSLDVTMDANPDQVDVYVKCNGTSL